MENRASQSETRLPFERHAITLPPELAAAAREEMRARGLTSFSAYVAETIRRDLESCNFEELLDDMFRDQPMSEEELGWANRALYG